MKNKIGDYNSKYGVFCGEFRGKKIWCDLHNAPNRMNWEDAQDYCKKQGGTLPDIDVLTWVFLNKNEINKGLEANGGDGFSEDDYYWSSSEYSSIYSWLLDMDSGFRAVTKKTSNGYVRSFQLL